MTRACFPNVSQFAIRETSFPGSVFVSKMQIMLTLHGKEILTKIRVCEQLQKFCEQDQVSTHLIFASNSSNGQILRPLSNWMGQYPSLSSGCTGEHLTFLTEILSVRQKEDENICVTAHVQHLNLVITPNSCVSSVEYNLCACLLVV